MTILTLLKTSVLNRTTKLYPPPPLVSASGEKLKYGLGVPAPWNSSSSSAGGDTKDKAKDNPNAKEIDEKDTTSLPDAHLYATWNYETHDFRQPIPPHMRNRGRVGSSTIPGGHGPPQRPTISIRSEHMSHTNGALSRKNSKALKDGKWR